MSCLCLQGPTEEEIRISPEYNADEEDKEQNRIVLELAEAFAKGEKHKVRKTKKNCFVGKCSNPGYRPRFCAKFLSTNWKIYPQPIGLFLLTLAFNAGSFLTSMLAGIPTFQTWKRSSSQTLSS